jgi:hypothetical protein
MGAAAVPGLPLQLPPEQQQALMAQMMAAQAANPQLMMQMMAAQAANPQLAVQQSVTPQPMDAAAMMQAMMAGAAGAAAAAAGPPKKAQCCVCKGSKTRQYRFGFMERGRGDKIKIVEDNEMDDSYHWGQVLADFNPKMSGRQACGWPDLFMLFSITIVLLPLYFLLKGAFTSGSECVRCEGTGEVTWNARCRVWRSNGTQTFGGWGEWYERERSERERSERARKAKSERARGACARSEVLRDRNERSSEKQAQRAERSERRREASASAAEGAAFHAPSLNYFLCAPFARAGTLTALATETRKPGRCLAAMYPGISGISTTHSSRHQRTGS